jgi:hypothetical protein
MEPFESAQGRDPFDSSQDHELAKWPVERDGRQKLRG